MIPYTNDEFSKKINELSEQFSEDVLKLVKETGFSYRIYPHEIIKPLREIEHMILAVKAYRIEAINIREIETKIDMKIDDTFPDADDIDWRNK